MKVADFENIYSRAITVNMKPKDFELLTQRALFFGMSRNELIRQAIYAYLGGASESKGN